ncbi:MAG: hypothetical protein K2P79_10840 [Sphingomonas sp.]|nr:hypothetical protein [Sphingomonas sp.]
MNGGSRIIDLRQDVAQPMSDSFLPPPDVEPSPPPLFAEYGDDDGIDPPRSGYVTAALVTTVAALWTGGALWLTLPSLQAGLTPLDLVQLIGAICAPLILIALLWLLALRTSRAEAQRFGATARAMRGEAAALEQTMAVIANRIEENRRALGEQTAALLAVGDTAADRLVAISNGMAQEIKTAGAQTTRLTAAIATAQHNLEVMLASLPKAHADANDMARTIEQTGLAASGHAASLDAQLTALSERGREADGVATGAAAKLAAHIQRMEATSETAGARLESVTESMSDAVDALLGRTAGAVDEARKGITAQGEAMLAMLEANQAALGRASRDSAEAMAERISAIEAVIDRIAARLTTQRGASDEIVATLDNGLSKLEHRITEFHDRELERSHSLKSSIDALSGSAESMTRSLGAGGDLAARVIETAETLLTSLDAATREIDETLPEALARLDARISESRRAMASAKPELLTLVTAAEQTHDAVEAIAQLVSGQRAIVDRLSLLIADTLNVSRTRADELGATLDEAFNRTHDFTEQAAPRLLEAMIRVRDTATTAAERARETLASVIPEAAHSLELASAQAMQRAVGASVERQVVAIADAADGAVEAATRASERLTRQMMLIAESAAMVENRIEDARAERDKADSDSFARRAALLIESLNSASIDLSKSLSDEVSDASWASYLKGDRGVFTRRAVRLLDTGDAREVARLYEDDGAFREQVNRYIHDFEAMLRAVLTQRDGASLGVTLLSADMGKLYVALAQAIERLRG